MYGNVFFLSVECYILSHIVVWDELGVSAMLSRVPTDASFSVICSASVTVKFAFIRVEIAHYPMFCHLSHKCMFPEDTLRDPLFQYWFVQADKGTYEEGISANSVVYIKIYIFQLLLYAAFILKYTFFKPLEVLCPNVLSKIFERDVKKIHF